MASPWLYLSPSLTRPPPGTVHESAAESGLCVRVAAEHSGGMIAAIPREDYAQLLAVPGGDPADELHVTLVFLGDNVGGQPSGGLEQLSAQLAAVTPAIPARVFGHALFNPQPPVLSYGDTDDESPEPCAVYLVNDLSGQSPLTRLHDEVAAEAGKVFNLPYQHQPFVAHITAGYNIDVSELTFVGDIIFDRLRLAFAGQHTDYPLGG